MQIAQTCSLGKKIVSENCSVWILNPILQPTYLGTNDCDKLAFLPHFNLWFPLFAHWSSRSIVGMKILLHFCSSNLSLPMFGKSYSKHKCILIIASIKLSELRTMSVQPLEGWSFFLIDIEFLKISFNLYISIMFFLMVSFFWCTSIWQASLMFKTCQTTSW